MDLRDTIIDIRKKIKLGGFQNEASVIQGIVMRIFSSLSWPTFDTQIVHPEYSLEGRRIDIALCHPKEKPLAFVEVKQIGNSEGADRQLFEYAFHIGVPMAILTDGQEWHFYLPAEQGSYQERRVYNLDILERDLSEIVNRLNRYLSYEAVKSGKAIENARKDYKDVSKVREIKKHLPIAWNKLITEQDELLIELIIDKVESLCGYRPTLGQVESFLIDFSFPPQKSSLSKKTAQKNTKHNIQKDKPSHKCGFYLNNKFHPAKNKKDVLVQVYEKFTQIDKTFPKRFASLPKHGTKRRYLSDDKYKLYPDRPDLADGKSYQLESGWWISINYGKKAIKKIITLAAEVMGLKMGKEIEIHLGD